MAASSRTCSTTSSRSASSTSRACRRRHTWSTSSTPCGPTSRCRACRSRSCWRRRPSRSTAASASRARVRPGMTNELIELTRRAGGRERPRRRARPGGAVRGLPGARRRRRAERVHLGRRRPPDGSSRAQSPLAGVPLAVKDLFCTEGVPSQAGSRILEGYRPPYTATVVAKLAEAGAPLLGKTNQDEFAMGSSNENSGFGPGPQPVGPRRGFPAAHRGKRGGGRGRAGAVGDRHRHRRIDPPARGAVRDRRPASRPTARARATG